LLRVNPAVVCKCPEVNEPSPLSVYGIDKCLKCKGVRMTGNMEVGSPGDFR